MPADEDALIDLLTNECLNITLETEMNLLNFCLELMYVHKKNRCCSVCSIIKRINKIDEQTMIIILFYI